MTKDTSDYGSDSYLEEIGEEPHEGEPITSSDGVMGMSPEEVVNAANMEASAQGLPIEAMEQEDGSTLYGLKGGYGMEVSQDITPIIRVGERAHGYAVTSPMSQFDLTEIERSELITTGQEARETVSNIVNEFGAPEAINALENRGEDPNDRSSGINYDSLFDDFI